MKLLDGTTADRKELLKKMDASDQFYYEVMGLDKVLSYSSAKYLLESPKWFLHKKNKPDPESQALRDGRLVHSQILEPLKYDTFEFVETSTKSTKKWKLAVEEFGKANTYTMKEKYMNTRISSAFLQNDRCVSFMKGSSIEISGLYEQDGLPFRGKADILRAGEFVADVKTTGGGLKDITLKSGETVNQFSFSVKDYHYDLQAYLYTQMFNVKDFYWLVVDKITTDIGIFKASENTLASGKLKLDAACKIYDAFFVSDVMDLSQYHKTDTI
tara:strand:- start:101 stop:913 length:813 start_codon:yes stop_codon:yes gene_type:complete